MSNEDFEDLLFRDLRNSIGKEVLVISQASQLNLLGQTFRPIFCGTVSEVEMGHVTLFPVIIKMVNAPFFQFPIPLSIPLEKIAHLTFDFDCDTIIPLT
ncbi:hypothetical protein LCL95_08755 [Bacillus timonensis]|nr:hypothetical protein [Bacillus timonensis]